MAAPVNAPPSALRLHTSAPQESGRSFLDETADAFGCVFRSLQPALLLLQLCRRDIGPVEYSFPRIGQGRGDREGGLSANQGRDFDRALTLTPGRDHFLDEPQPQGSFGVELFTGQEVSQGVAQTGALGHPDGRAS